MRKKIIIILLKISLLAQPVFGQSFLKMSVNTFKFNDYQNGFNLGLGIGHQIYLYKFKSFTAVLNENMDINRSDFYYYDGGLGAGTSNRGHVRFVNLNLDFRIRYGKKLFAEIGGFYSLALSKKIKNEQSIYSQYCGFPGTNCPQPRTVPFDDQIKRSDYGLLMGAGGQIKGIVLSLDYQYGLLNIVDLIHTTFSSRQINLNAAIPFSVFNGKNND